MKLFLSLFLLTISSLIIYSLSSTPVFAQLEVTQSYDLIDQSAVTGDIVSYTSKGLGRAEIENDSKIFGVIQTNPPISYKRLDGTGSPVTRSGTSLVNVTTINGDINVGDYITSSTLPGKGEKSETSGYVVGVALEPFKAGSGTKVSFTPAGATAPKQVDTGTISVAIKVEYAELNTARNANRLLDAVNSAFFANVSNPEKFVNVIRYIAAGLAILISFGVGFFTFARTIPKGIEALGRNPLARNTIQLGIIINIIFTIGIALIGVVAAVILLRF